MGYAEVSVNSPAAQRRTFSYTIPADLNIEIGQTVWVPFGSKLLQGIVLELTDYPAVTETREIAGVIEDIPLLSPPRISLARWISGYYLSPLFEAISLMLPPGFKRKALTFISTTPAAEKTYTTAELTEEQKHLINLIRSKGRIDFREIEKALGIRKARLITSQLINHGLLTGSHQLERVKVRPRKIRHLHLLITPGEAIREATRLRQETRAEQQAWLLEFLSGMSRPIPLAEVKKGSNYSNSAIRALIDKGLAGFQEVEVRRETLPYHDTTPSRPLPLTNHQELALAAIRASLLKARENRPHRDVFLLHGVTGSGKTEVYMQALAEVVKQGKRGIVLVPEIALTAQTIERFVSRFPNRVAVLHSRLSLGEQFDEWHQIRNGRADVVIGSRSAIFAPQPDLGLIIIDEEHEWTYKQHDATPRYRARDVAIKLAELTGAVVVLGSATPDVETFYQTQKGVYRLLRMPERVVPQQGSPLPDVELVDMRSELKAGNRSIFSRPLFRDVSKAVASQEQVILFLNRRGGATFVQCRNCGLVLCCRRCAVTLTYHFSEDTLVCHQCNYREVVPHTCPRCSSHLIKFLGAGTEKLEQEASLTFPQARLLRWDRDTTKGKASHHKILDCFRSHGADILIGTQMIAKGLHLPLVTLVGIVNADLSLNLPDFRAGERSFQLLSQVMGRAGRGASGGKVIIQTYCPEHYAIQAASRHDYELFYEQEINYRRQLRNPPFTRLACLTYSHNNDTICQREAERMKQRLNDEIETKGIDNIDLIGPAPAFLHRLRGRFRWQLMIRGAEPSRFLAEILLPKGWTIDIDPAGLA
ncbi:MAG: primosomal protein N' [Dehalococcoidales bacterium]|nr:primosomal protein N' [Dehalococcoidales bacterium]